jgi:hypothetical protein
MEDWRVEVRVVRASLRDVSGVSGVSGRGSGTGNLVRRGEIQSGKHHNATTLRSGDRSKIQHPWWHREALQPWSHAALT